MPAYRLRVAAMGVGVGMLLVQVGVPRVLVVGACAGIIITALYSQRRTLLLVGLAIILGGLWANLRLTPMGNSVNPPRTATVLEGIIQAVRQSARGSNHVTMRAENLSLGSPRIVSVATPSLVSVGDRIRVRCRWTVVDDQWSCFSRDIVRGPGGTVRSWSALAAAIHQQIQASLEWVLPEPERSIAAAMVFGYSDGLPPSIKNQFRTTGTSHLMVASGMQVVLTIQALEWILLLIGFSRRARIVLLLPMIMVLLLVIGFTASSIRGAVMGYLPALSLTLGRGRMGVHTLLLAGVVMGLADPTILTQMNFQLSFLATAGILVLTPVIQERLNRAIPKQWASEFATTLGATLATVPVVSIAFGIVNPAIIIPNLMLVALVIWIMALTVLVSIVGIISSTLATPLGIVLTVLLWIVSGIVGWSAALITAHPSSSVVLGSGVVLLALSPILITAYEHIRWRVRPPTGVDCSDPGLEKATS